MSCMAEAATTVRVPRLAHRPTTCAGATLVTINGQTYPAIEWAARRGLKWQTVKMRRMRGDNWVQALEPELRRSSWMGSWIMKRGRETLHHLEQTEHCLGGA